MSTHSTLVYLSVRTHQSLISSSTWVGNVIIRKYETWLLFSDSDKHSSLLLKCENDNKKAQQHCPDHD
jgi:hypothetical protein